MTLEREQRVVAAHAVAVIDDADELPAAGFNFHANACGAGVESVFQQLLHHRCGALDYFAGGDLVRYLVREDTDLSHGSSYHCFVCQASALQSSLQKYSQLSRTI